MHTENVVFIRGPIARIYRLACHVQDWPKILPHYRAVEVLEGNDDGSRKIVEMAATRSDFPGPGIDFPVSWRSVQICEPELRQVTYKHIRGIATGMWVVWNMEPDPWGRGVRVSIRHELRYPFTMLNGWFANRIVGEAFVQSIAGQTLQTIRQIVERGSPRAPLEGTELH